MIQFSIYDDKGEKLRITAPHSWRELNLQQLIDIENEELNKEGLMKLFSIICGIEFHQVAQSTDSTLYDRIRAVCEFVGQPPTWEKLPFPKHLEIAGQVVKVPAQVNNIMHGQIELLTEIGKSETLLADMPRAIAIILQPYLDREKNKGKLIYDGDRVDEIEPAARQASGIECYALAFFFFRKLANFLTIGMQNSAAYLKRRTRSKTYYDDWLTANDLTAMPV